MSWSLFNAAGTPTQIPFQAYFIDANKDPVLTATGKISIRRASDGMYFNGTTFQVAEIFITMTKYSDTNAPGWWFFFLDTTGFQSDSYTGFMKDDSVATTTDNTPQVSEEVLNDGIAHQVDLSASAAVGMGKYTIVDSKLKLWAWNDPNRLIATFDMKDLNGLPAGSNKPLEKIPV